MNKKEKALKNDVLDLIECLESLVCLLNKGKRISAKKGSYDSFLLELEDIKRAFRDVTLKEDEEDDDYIPFLDKCGEQYIPN